MRCKLRLETNRALSDSVRSLVFEFLPPRAMDYLPGQALDLFVPTESGMVTKRPYSIASAPGRAGVNRIEIAVTRIEGGAASRALHELRPGAVLEAEGPRGGFVWRTMERNAPTLFVATGTGLAPIRAMLQDELSRSGSSTVGLLFGCRQHQNVLWEPELLAWSKGARRLELAVTLSRADPSWSGRTGYVQSHVTELVAALQPRLVFVCGLTPMIEAVSERLIATGVPEGSIRTENYDL